MYFNALMRKLFFADIDECGNGNNDCDGAANFACVNTPGSFICVCGTGYELVEGNCVGEILFIVNAVKIIILGALLLCS